MVDFLPARVDVERRSDGALIMRSPAPLGPYARSLGEYVVRWALEKPNAVFLAQRDGDRWRTLTWADAHTRVRRIGAALIRRKLSAERPVAILSDNSIEHALLTLACMHVGIPAAPISSAYSLLSKDFRKLRSVFALLDPGLVFADHAERFAPALTALGRANFEFTAIPPEDSDERGVDEAFGAIDGDTIAKFLLTSGSTGEPKAVINTQRMLCSNIRSRAQVWPFLDEEPPVLVDWLPWNHTFGGNNNLGLILGHGGTLYIDEGKPAPGLIETTVRNLSDVSPTIYYNAPRGYEMLVPYLEHDLKLRRTFFARLKVLLYAAAALPPSLWERLEQLSIAELGRCVHILSAWGSTETAPQVTLGHFKPVRSSIIGLPTPGCEVKMIPLGKSGKCELRVRGPNVTPGYWKAPDLTEAAFDEEGFYRIGDAGRLADPDDPAKGIEFAGRLAEDFKLSSGTWVHVGALRVRAIAAMSPLVQDIVIAGHDSDEIGFLIFPSAAGFSDPQLHDTLRAAMRRLAGEGIGTSTYATRAICLTEPPSIDAGEITDKGYINQRAVLERRSEIVAQLYSNPVGPDVITVSP